MVRAKLLLVNVCPLINCKYRAQRLRVEKDSTTEGMNEIQNKISNFLNNELGLEDEEPFREYIMLLLFPDEAEEEAEDHVFDIISEFLLDAASDSDSAAIKDFVSALTAEATTLKLEMKKRKAAETADQLIKSLSAVKVSLVDNVDPSLRHLLVETRAPQKKTEVSRLEKQEREKLLAKYGYELEEAVEGADGETEIVFKSAATKTDPLFSLSQSNAEMVREKQRLQKLQHQEKHLKEKARNKEMQEKQKLEKELKKKGTQKKEKQRS